MISLNAQIQVRAEELEQKGFKGLDALHIASAEWAKADRFWVMALERRIG